MNLQPRDHRDLEIDVSIYNYLHGDSLSSVARSAGVTPMKAYPIICNRLQDWVKGGELDSHTLHQNLSEAIREEKRQTAENMEQLADKHEVTEL